MKLWREAKAVHQDPVLAWQSIVSDPVKAKASASALYLVFYYLGASSGGLYLSPFWQHWGWNGVVVGSLLMFMLTLVLSLWLKHCASKAP